MTYMYCIGEFFRGVLLKFIHIGANWQFTGAEKKTHWGRKKGMNGADLPGLF